MTIDRILPPKQLAERMNSPSDEHVGLVDQIAQELLNHLGQKPLIKPAQITQGQKDYIDTLKSIKSLMESQKKLLSRATLLDVMGRATDVFLSKANTDQIEHAMLGSFGLMLPWHSSFFEQNGKRNQMIFDLSNAIAYAITPALLSQLSGQEVTHTLSVSGDQGYRRHYAFITNPTLLLNDDFFKKMQWPRARKKWIKPNDKNDHLLKALDQLNSGIKKDEMKNVFAHIMSAYQAAFYDYMVMVHQQELTHERIAPGFLSSWTHRDQFLTLASNILTHKAESDPPWGVRGQLPPKNNFLLEMYGGQSKNFSFFQLPNQDKISLIETIDDFAQKISTKSDGTIDLVRQGKILADILVTSYWIETCNMAQKTNQNDLAHERNQLAMIDFFDQVIGKTDLAFQTKIWGELLSNHELQKKTRPSSINFQKLDKNLLERFFKANEAHPHPKMEDILKMIDPASPYYDAVLSMMDKDHMVNLLAKAMAGRNMEKIEALSLHASERDVQRAIDLFFNEKFQGAPSFLAKKQKALLLDRVEPLSEAKADETQPKQKRKF